MSNKVNKYLRKSSILSHIDIKVLKRDYLRSNKGKKREIMQAIREELGKQEEQGNVE